LKFAELGRVFSLQRDAGSNTLPPGAPIYDTETGQASWESTVAVMSEMDYVVTNDTSTGHLAGVLGKKTLVLLPHAPHHYWLPFSPEVEPRGIPEVRPREIRGSYRALWYPNMNCFRQPKYNDWEGAVANACAHIAQKTV
ncbi:MAG: glycosyltransferase family 9 protein, partial [Patescibacteria group bacterium]